MNNVIEQEKVVTRGEIREAICRAESLLKSMPGSMEGDCFPLKHQFAEGMYIREILVPATAIVITKIHKHSHPVFIMQGECSVIDERGAVRIKAPYYMITPAGTKRVVYVHKNTQWVTVHKTEYTDLEEIEEEIIAKDFSEVLTAGEYSQLIDIIEKEK